MDLETKNLVFKEIFELSTTVFPDGTSYEPSLVDIQIIYDGTPASDRARRFLVEFYAEVGEVDWLEGFNDLSPK
ncbi:hypothetical protein BCR34DRAFT_651806 [Clohesyomyces aquaticus]|uniref:Uncharacterized protein n=1 Tax=Clohesyomyces aquaticus TaxID=1231657 RepID=A0A1Y1ZQE7_9PLEO|nr:hypothetical protein BCR34DRAFT_651806 [Clohesyomyces aquaticus]